MLVLATTPSNHATSPSEPALYAWKQSPQSPQSPVPQSPPPRRTLRRLDAFVHRSLPTKPFDQDVDERREHDILESLRARRNLSSDVSIELHPWDAPDLPSPVRAAQLHQQQPSMRALLPSYSHPSTTPSLTRAPTPYTTPLTPMPPGNSPQAHTCAHPTSPRPYISKFHSPPALGSDCNEPESQPLTLRRFSLIISTDDYRLPSRTPWAKEPGGEPSHPKQRTPSLVWGSNDGSQPTGHASGGATSGLHSEQLTASSYKWMGETAGSSDGTACSASQPQSMQAVYDNIHREVFTPSRPSSGGQPLRASLQRPMSLQPQLKSNSRPLCSQPVSSVATRATRASEPGNKLDISDDRNAGTADLTKWPDVKAYVEDLQYVTQEELQYVMSCFQAAGAPKPQAKQPPTRPGSALRPSVPQRTPLQRQASMPPQPSTALPSRTRLLQHGSGKEASSERWDHAAAAPDARLFIDAGYRSQQTPERTRERFSDSGVRSQALPRAGRSLTQDTIDDDEDMKYMTAAELQYVKQHGPGAGSKGAAPQARCQASPSPQRFRSMKATTTSFRSSVPAASPVRLQAARSTSQPRRAPARTSPSFKSSSASPGNASPGAEKWSGHPGAPAAGDEAVSWRGAQEQQPASFAEYQEDLKYMTAEELQYVMKQYNSSKPQATQAASPPRRGASFKSPHTSRRA